VLSAVAPVVLATYGGAEYLAHRDRYAATKSIATGAARWASTAFPTMGYALGAALLVIVVRLVRERKGARRG
jgi:hypothetical protein